MAAPNMTRQNATKSPSKASILHDKVKIGFFDGRTRSGLETDRIWDHGSWGNVETGIRRSTGPGSASAAVRPSPALALQMARTWLRDDTFSSGQGRYQQFEVLENEVSDPMPGPEQGRLCNEDLSRCGRGRLD